MRENPAEQADQEHDEVRPPNYGLHLALFLATCFTTAWAGASYTHPRATFDELWRLLPDGIPFSVGLLAILITHEMGHYVLGRIHKVDVSLPFFLPLPFFGMIGTFGAVIRMRGVIRRRDALADIGAAGPLAGLVVAIVVLVLGLHLSPIKAVGVGMLEGNSALYLAAKFLVKGQILPGNGVDVSLHSLAWAGWVGLLVTMINLLPIGQLDGGHIAFAYFGDRHDVASRWLHRALLPLAVAASAYTVFELAQAVALPKALALGSSAGMPWLVWWILLTAMYRMSGRRYHPPVDPRPLSRGRRRLCVLMLLIFLLILTPIPLRVTVAPA
jgi:membrane-associated protease RseP (regulator of RpoE activity)